MYIIFYNDLSGKAESSHNHTTVVLNNTYVLLKKIDNMMVLNLSGTGTCKQIKDTIGTLAAAYRPSFQIYGCIMIFDSANTRYAMLVY